MNPIVLHKDTWLFTTICHEDLWQIIYAVIFFYVGFHSNF